MVQLLVDGHLFLGGILLIGLLPASIAYHKGHNFLLWWLFGAALFIVAVPAAILVQPNQRELERRQIEAGEVKRCPYCAELARAEAIVCPHCHKDISLKKPGAPSPREGR